MWTKIESKEYLTLGELREIVNNNLSNYPDDTPVIMSPKIEDDLYGEYKIIAIIADEDSVNFYNY